MARPKKEGLDYFSHDVYASSDEKIEPLILLYGAKGYAFYFLHLEYIYRNPALEFDISDAETRDVLCQKLHITGDEYDQILQTCLKKKCFDKSYFDITNRLTSDGVKKRAAAVLEKREKMRLAYEKKVSDAEAPPAPEESKGKKRKVKESNITSEHIQMAERLKSFIVQNNPGAKVPDDTTKWAEEFEKMMRIDHRTPEQISSVMEFSQRDSFWRCNILSAGKLREKFDMLTLRNNQSGNIFA